MKSDNHKSTEDIEIKDASLIFNSVWKSLVTKYGEENMVFPEEIFWLNGAPGSGKGTNTRFIMNFRSISASPVVVSNLLKTPEAKELIDKGILVGDREVTELVFGELLKPVNRRGVIVDGFPRTQVQVDCLHLLYKQLKKLRRKYQHTAHSPKFRRPKFHIVVLFIDEKESVARQIKRGEQMIQHNEKVDASGVGEKVVVRATDLSRDTAIERYRTFKSVTYQGLQSLRKEFNYHYIDAYGSIEEVRRRIIEELKYQSSLELDEKTHERICVIPLAENLIEHARQNLVSRLDGYERDHTELFADVVKLIDESFMPVIIRHAVPGAAIINSQDRIFNNPLAISMIIDIFSERGYTAVADSQEIEVPIRIDPQTNRVENTIKNLYRFTIRFEGSTIRRNQ